MRIEYHFEAQQKVQRVSISMNASTATKNNRLGFTLIELLAVIGLIAFMTGMITYALMGAQGDARVARTRSTIQKLNEIILQRWEEYRYRPVDIRKSSFNISSVLTALQPRSQAYLRMLILRDTMRMEMPDRISDLIYGPAIYTVPSHIVQSGGQLEQRSIPHNFGILYSALFSALQNSTHSSLAASLSNLPATGFFDSTNNLALSTQGLDVWDDAVQSSELLYLIISTSNFGGTAALELFRPSDIGDPDGDGLLEFVDAWGQPIRWIRWPAGFPSDLNRYSGSDAMDPLNTDWRYSDANFTEVEKPQTIVPLIVSAGPDQLFGERFDFYAQSAPTIPTTVYATMRQSSNPPLMVDPYFVFVNGAPNNDSNAASLKPAPVNLSPAEMNRQNQLGSIESPDLFADDVTNHDLILEP
jgi:Prokaryotic N-terminal methylation motif